MEKINLTDFQKRKLKKFYLAVYVVTKEIVVRTDTCISERTLFILWGLDIMGDRQVLGIFFDNPKDNRFWLEIFEDIQARNAQKILFFITSVNRNIERCIKIVYNGINIIHSPDEIFSAITKFWADKPSKKKQIALKNLFLAEDINEYYVKYDMFKQAYANNKIILMMLDKKQKDIKQFYQFSKSVRKIFYPFYTIREMKKFLNKLKNKEPLCTNITEIIEFCIPFIISFEIGRSYSKLEWLDLISDLYEQYPDVLEEYLDD